nr:hypothetical protein CFP56_16771 [Quercus suber]
MGNAKGGSGKKPPSSQRPREMEFVNDYQLKIKSNHPIPTLQSTDLEVDTTHGEAATRKLGQRAVVSTFVRARRAIFGQVSRTFRQRPRHLNFILGRATCNQRIWCPDTCRVIYGAARLATSLHTMIYWTAELCLATMQVAVGARPLALTTFHARGRDGSASQNTFAPCIARPESLRQASLSFRRHAATALIVPALDLAQAHDLQHLAPEPNRLSVERRLVRVDDGSFPDQIGLGGRDELGALEDLPEGEGHDRHEEHGVVREEGVDRPGKEGGVAIAADDREHPCQPDVGTVWLEPAAVRERFAVETLCLTSAIIEDKGHAHVNIIDLFISLAWHHSQGQKRH